MVRVVLLPKELILVSWWRGSQLLFTLVTCAIAGAVLAWLRQLSARSDLGGGRLGWRSPPPTPSPPSHAIHTTSCLGCTCQMQLDETQVKIVAPRLFSPCLRLRRRNITCFRPRTLSHAWSSHSIYNETTGRSEGAVIPIETRLRSLD